MSESSPYIDIIHVGPSESGKTQIYHVVNKRNGLGDQPGIIKWNGGWRKYVYHSDEAYYDHQCLAQISEFLARATSEHKQGIVTPGTATIEEYQST